MSIFKCKMCGGSLEVQEDMSVAICEYCGCKQAISDLDNGLNSSKNKSKTVISLDDDVRILLNKCKRDPINALRYANLILDIDPTNKEALIYLKKR